ncbi:MAG TPA: biotin/lipoate A/B protein ligase family protein [Pirellulales bacterium]|jgi:lipoate-protein ligase A
MNSWRLIENPPAAGDWNMAVDAALMESVAATGQCCLRFYSWAEPTLSLGYFQNAADRQRHTASQACPIVRRSTGGGAIVHDRELTYSLVVPTGHPLVARPPELYLLLHRTLIEALSDWQIVAKICPDTINRSSNDEPFLCFERRAEMDVVLDDWKIAGSAQRRRRGAVLQHGSVLLKKSSAAPELFGIIDVGGKVVEGDALATAWREQLAKQCKISWQKIPLDAAESERATDLVGEIYGQPGWTQRR